jgi:hypothetical protein
MHHLLILGPQVVHLKVLHLMHGPQLVLRHGLRHGLSRHCAAVRMQHTTVFEETGNKYGWLVEVAVRLQFEITGINSNTTRS